MGLELRWTARGRRKIARHGVPPAEVASFFSSRVYHRRKGRRITVIGRTNGRRLFLVLEPLPGEPGLTEVVTARNPTLAEKRLLARRGKGLQ